MAAVIDADRNRLFLDPILTGRMPETLAAAIGPDHARFLDDDDLRVVSAPIDFLGVNYYFRTHVGAVSEDMPAGAMRMGIPDVGAFQYVPEGPERTGFGWPIEPDGLRELLVRLRDDYPRLPEVVITENGAAFDDPVGPDGEIEDAARIAYVESHLGAVLDAIDEGVPVTGYFAWSLLDNFEWAAGYSQRFGLVRVDYETQQRTIKASGRRYADIVSAHSLTPADSSAAVMNAASASRSWASRSSA